MDFEVFNILMPIQALKGAWLILFEAAYLFDTGMIVLTLITKPVANIQFRFQDYNLYFNLQKHFSTISPFSLLPSISYVDAWQNISIKYVFTPQNISNWFFLYYQM